MSMQYPVLVKQISIILLTWLLAVGSSSGSTKNLLVNGGFEADMRGGDIPGWEQSLGLRHQQVWLESDDVKSGERSLGIRIVRSTGLDALDEHSTNTTPEKHSILSQTIPLEKDSRYMFSIWFKRDTFVFGSYLYLHLYGENGEQLRSFRQVLRASDWMNFQIAFSSGEAVKAKVQIFTPNAGSWRVTVGRALWLDDASLVKVDSADQIDELGVAAALAGEALLHSDAAGRLYPWLELDVPEEVQDAWLELEVEGNAHHFRTYHRGDSVWVQPILPDLVVAEGVYPVRLQASPKIDVKRILLTRDATWRPEGAVEFQPVEEVASAALLEHVSTQSEVEVRLRIDGDLPTGIWPVAQGVPFPRGVLYHDNDLSLSDAAGKEIAMQSDVLMHWPDGSIRWLLLSTQGAAGQELVLKNNVKSSGPAPVNAVAVHQDSTTVVVDNKVIEIRIPKQGEHLLGLIKVGGKVLFSAANLQINEKFTARSSQAKVTVEEAGPLRAVIRISGSCLADSKQQFLDYDLRLIAHANSSRLDVEYTFYHRTEPLEIAIDSMELVFLAAPGVGFEQAELEYGEQWHTLAVRADQIELNAELTEGASVTASYPYVVKRNDAVVHKGHFYPGGFALAGRGVAVRGWIQDFWQNSPRSLRFTNGELGLGIVGEPGSPFYMGMAKTSRFALDLAGNSQSIAAYRAEPLLLAESEWYASTQATGHYFAPREADTFEAYEYSMQLAIDRWIERTENSMKRLVGAGILNYGDPVGGRNDHGNNLETARDEGSLIQFLRTLDRDVYQHARVSIDHFVDIDIDHSDNNRGLIWVHGKHARDRVDADRSGVNGHSWFNGVTHFEMFRGSRRIHDLARNVGDYYSKHGFELEPYVRPWRPLSWQLMSLMQAYAVTQDPTFLAQARQSMIVTRHQRDFLIEEWPYMFSTGLKAVRMYYQATGDPEAKELYLQLMDGFLRLRERPTDTVNGEWLKPKGTLLGNFPNDRSCLFYNEAAWAYWLSGDRAYVDRAATDLNWHSSFAVSDPTLLAGSADLVRAMRELEIEDASVAVHLPYVEMPTEHEDILQKEGLRAGVVQFVVENKTEGSFELILFKGARFKYMIPYAGKATLTDIEGNVLDQIEVSNKGINIYRLQSGGPVAKGRYVVTVELDNIWQWTVQEIPLQLKAGRNLLEVVSRTGVFSVDAFAIAPIGVFPWLEDETDAIVLVDDQAMRWGEGWQRFSNDQAQGGSYVRRAAGTNKSVLQVPVDVAEDGEYRLYARIWRPSHDALDISVNGGEVQTLNQVHDMSGSRVEPVWSLAVQEGEVEVVRYWVEELVFTTYTSAFFDPETVVDSDDWDIVTGEGRVRLQMVEAGQLLGDRTEAIQFWQEATVRDFAMSHTYADEAFAASKVPYRIRFALKITDLSAFEKADKTWLRFFSSPRGNRAGAEASFWFGALSGQRDNQFVAWNGDRDGAVSATVETGVIVHPDRVYQFEIEVYPDSRSWRLRISEGDTVFESDLLGWRTGRPDPGSVLTVNTQINNPGGDGLAMIVSTPEVEQL